MKINIPRRIDTLANQQQYEFIGVKLTSDHLKLIKIISCIIIVLYLINNLKLQIKFFLDCYTAVSNRSLSLPRNINGCGLPISSLDLCITIYLVKVCRSCHFMPSWSIIIQSMVVYVAIIVFP
jgi:hypothetical protein